MTPEGRHARAARLRELRSHDDIKDAIESVKDDIRAEWERTFVPSERENLWNALQGVERVWSRIAEWSHADLSAIKRAK